jgi:hypothetical protein
MTGPPGRRISRQFFVKTTTSATTLRFRLNFGFLSSNTCRLFQKFIDILGGGLYFTIGEVEAGAFVRFDFGPRALRGKMLVTLLH